MANHFTVSKFADFFSYTPIACVAFIVVLLERRLLRNHVNLQMRLCIFPRAVLLFSPL